MKKHISTVIIILVLILAVIGFSRAPDQPQERQAVVDTPRLFTDSVYGWYTTYDPQTQRIEYARDRGPESIHSLIFSGARTPGDWDFSVGISSTTFRTLAEFEKNLSSDVVFIEHRTIGGKLAAIYEETSRPGVMFAFILHNNRIYSIWTNSGADREHVWNNFQFLF